MITHDPKEIEILREGGKLLSLILSTVSKAVKPGVQTLELDTIADREIKKYGGIPSFKNYRTHGTKSSYPASLCVSINNEIVHGIPSERALCDGDIVGLDIGMQYKGLFTDMAITVPVGAITPDLKKLINTTKEALVIGIREAKIGQRIGDIGYAIEKHLKKNKFGVVRELVGHGVGKAVHEEPEVPNWGQKGLGNELREGMVLALEPMATIGSPTIKVSRDGWVWSTKDGKFSAHFEHTILITKNGPEILTN